MKRFVILTTLLLAGCGASPLQPSPVPTPVAPVAVGRVVLSGQSNAVLIRSFMEGAYKGRVTTVAADGSRIAEWEVGTENWNALIPALHEPMRAFIWWQGESDYRDPVNYEAKLRAFLVRVRAEAGNSRLPVLLVRIVDDQWPGVPEIRAEQNSYARSDAQVILVSSDELPREHPEWATGSMHLSESGYQTMTTRIIAALP